MTDPSVLVCQPSLATVRHEIEMSDEHVFVGEREELGRFEVVKVESAERAVIG